MNTKYKIGSGDTFTRITIGVAAAWIIMIIIQVKLIQSSAGATGRIDATGYGTEQQK